MRGVRGPFFFITGADLLFFCSSPALALPAFSSGRGVKTVKWYLALHADKLFVN